MHGPTYIFWANLTPFSLQFNSAAKISDLNQQISVLKQKMQSPESLRYQVGELEAKRTQLVLQIELLKTEVKKTKAAGEVVAQLEEACQAIKTQEEAAVDAAAETLQPAIDAILDCDRTESPSVIDLQICQKNETQAAKRVQFGSVRMRSVSQTPHSVSHRRPHSVSQTPQPAIDFATPQPASDEVFNAMRAATPMEGGDVRYKRCQIQVTRSRRVCQTLIKC
jgi:cell division protein FtsB